MNCRKVWKAIGFGWVFPWTFNQPNWWDEKTTAFQQKRDEAMGIFGDIGGWMDPRILLWKGCMRAYNIYIYQIVVLVIQVILAVQVDYSYLQY